MKMRQLAALGKSFLQVARNSIAEDRSNKTATGKLVAAVVDSTDCVRAGSVREAMQFNKAGAFVKESSAHDAPALPLPVRLPCCLPVPVAIKSLPKRLDYVGDPPLGLSGEGLFLCTGVGFLHTVAIQINSDFLNQFVIHTANLY
jgi:hypothetical protein